MPISEFSFVGCVFCSLVSIYSLIFWSVWSVIEQGSLPKLAARLRSAGVVSDRAESFYSNWGLGHDETESVETGDKVKGATGRQFRGFNILRIMVMLTILLKG